MEDFNDLIFEPDSGMFDVASSASLKDLEDLILDDNYDDSKEIEDIFYVHIGPIPKFDNLEDCIIQD